ncbi:MAG: ATP-dependent DNA helicase RecQ [Deltaproteobacteria bacterium]|nr:ATP-dependent DNA helicase RecQ [Deltaproteobacteria bacterium]
MRSRARRRAAAGLDRQLDALEARARRVFAIAGFRPGQRDILAGVLAGHDVIGILPTGAGKSLCFQLPALVLPHTVVVVSPLLALIHDQHAKLDDRGIDATHLDSTLRAGGERAAIEEVSAGLHRIVYVTPERLEKPETLDALTAGGVSLLVVDEAHCVSQWGHDFRPAYLSIRDAVRALGRPPVLALTATATQDVRDDVTRQLALTEPLVVDGGTVRPNLRFEVARTVNDDVKRARLFELLEDTPRGTVIVYTATVRAADEVWAHLGTQGVSVGRYHARLPAASRRDAQDRFMSGNTRVMVATKAFGLGIDKPDIRLVAHYHVPDSLESYQQEAGRAGRDGALARAVLLYRLEDRRIQTYFLGVRYPRRSDSLSVFRVLGESPEAVPGGAGLTLADLAERAGLPSKRVRVVVAQLAGAGIVARGRRLHVIRAIARDDELEQLLAEYESRHGTDRDRLDAMTGYAESTRCRPRILREYFGEQDVAPCGLCDNCNDPLSPARV